MIFAWAAYAALLVLLAGLVTLTRRWDWRSLAPWWRPAAAPYGGGRPGAVPEPAPAPERPPPALPTAPAAHFAAPPPSGLEAVLQACVMVPRELLTDLDPSALRLYCELQAREQWREGTRHPFVGASPTAILTVIRDQWPRTDADRVAGRHGIHLRTLETKRDLLIGRGAIRLLQGPAAQGRAVCGYLTILPHAYQQPDERQLALALPDDTDLQIGAAGPQIGAETARSVDREAVRSAHPQIDPVLQPPDSPRPSPTIAVDVDHDRDRDRVDARATAPGRAPRPDTPPAAPAEPVTPASKTSHRDGANAAPRRKPSSGRAASSELPPLSEQQIAEFADDMKRRRKEYLWLFFDTPEVRARYPREIARCGFLGVSEQEALELGGVLDHAQRLPHIPIGYLFPSSMAQDLARLSAHVAPEQEQPDLPFETSPFEEAARTRVEFRPDGAPEKRDEKAISDAQRKVREARKAAAAAPPPPAPPEELGRFAPLWPQVISALEKKKPEENS